MQQGYDYVIISNSDVIYPRNLLTQMLRTIAHEGVGSVTAWSNNVSMYSLRNDDPDRFLADQERVDWLSETLADHYQDAVLDIPAGISFCILIPTAVVKDVGVMDPVFGRGYCEETDWSLRSIAAGYRVALAPGTFVYHAGRGSNLDAGLVTRRAHLGARERGDHRPALPRLPRPGQGVRGHRAAQAGPAHGVGAVMRRAGKELGYTIDAGWLPPSGGGGRGALHGRPRRARRGGDGVSRLPPRARRHRCVRGLRVAAGLLRWPPPPAVNLRDRGALAASLQSEFSGLTRRHGNYPSRV